MKINTKAAIVAAAVVVIACLLVMSQWSREEEGVKAAFDAEFLTRPDGYQGLGEEYGFRFGAAPLQMDPGLMYKAVADGAVDVIDAFATDGRIQAYDLYVLEDDEGFFPPYYGAPLVRKEALEERPELRDLLGSLAGMISDATMQQMSFEVDEKRRSARSVAREFLTRQGLIEEEARPGDGSDGKISIGGKQFTEQEILGEIMAILIETNSNIQVDRRFNLGGTMICFGALKAGDLDLYAEYTGTGLVSILDRDVVSDPDEAFDVVKEAFEKNWDLIWLEPFGLNNTYTLTMRREQAKELGIKTISDLADYVNKGE